MDSYNIPIYSPSSSSSTMFNYFQAFDTPPPYDEFSDIPLPPARFKVEPREEEGRERLPIYNSSIRREAIFERKVELESPFERAYDRKWQKVYVVLNNTLLSIYKPKRSPQGIRSSLLDDEDATYTPGSLIKQYTLQHTEVGAATDYKKKNYVLRIRAETQQFLLSCECVDLFMDWLESLSSGIDLALPLEERSLPKYQTIPRRRRRRRAAEVVQQQEEIIRQHFPQLLTDEQAARGRGSGAIDAVEEPANVPDLDDTSVRPSTADPIERRREEIVRPATASEEGKWRPGSRVTREAQLRFARRCMAVLTADAPRQSDYVMHAGTRYRLDYELRTLCKDGKRR